MVGESSRQPVGELPADTLQGARDMLAAGFTADQVARWFGVDAGELQRRLDNVPRQLRLFEVAVFQ